MFSSRDAVNQNQDRSESDELCDEPDTHSGLGQGPVDIRTYGLRALDSPGGLHCAVFTLNSMLQPTVVLLPPSKH